MAISLGVNTEKQPERSIKGFDYRWIAWFNHLVKNLLIYTRNLTIKG